MLEKGEAQALVISNPSKKLDATKSFLIAMQVEPDTVEKVAEKLVTVSSVRWVGVGVWNLFARVSLESFPDLEQFIQNEIKPIPGVSRTQAYSNIIGCKTLVSQER